MTIRWGGLGWLSVESARAYRYNAGRAVSAFTLAYPDRLALTQASELKARGKAGINGAATQTTPGSAIAVA